MRLLTRKSKSFYAGGKGELYNLFRVSILILATKLYFPPARANIVPRPRLIEQLHAGFGKPFTLISAPAGYGKTTLLCDWRARIGKEYPSAWLSLDPDDNNLARFLNYVSAALETLNPKLTQALISQLRLPQLPPMEELITTLINGVDAFPRDFALILDDYHAITDSAIHEALAYLLDHLPKKMHLVMLTRSDPPISLAKLRACGQMVELRAADLRFTSEETALFLHAVVDLNLSPENVKVLDQRTEGWIVGLQMAALSMQGKVDTSAFIKAFTGSNRYILDYFAEEVFHRQPESIQSFLLQTSILDRLTGSLCDAILGGPRNSAQTLMDLERKNLFLIPLDDERQWYRYHQLFADLLFTRLKQTQAEMLTELYTRAAFWLEQQGYLESSVGYALKAQDYEFAIRLMDQIKENLWNRGETRLFLNWLRTLPEELIRSQPEFCLYYAACLTIAGYFDPAEKWLRLAENRLGGMTAPDRRIGWGTYRIFLYRSVIARFHGDFAGAVTLCQRGLDQISMAEVRDRGVALLFMGHAHFYAGNTNAAAEVLTEAIQTNLASGHITAYLNACHHLAQLKVLQGCLREARAIYEQAALVVKEQGRPIYAGIELAGLGDLKIEWNNLEAARVDIKQGLELAEAGDDIFFLRDAYLSRVHLALAQKDWVSAQETLQKANRVARRATVSTDHEVLRAWQARLHLAQGNLAEAGPWAEKKSVEIEGSCGPQHEFELLTLARIWLAQGKTDQAAPLLEQIRIGAENAARHGRVLEVQMLQALSDQAAGKEMRAVKKIVPVLAQAEREEYVRLLIDEGAPMAKLLHKVTTQATAGIRDYAAGLLAAYSLEQAGRQVPLPMALRGDDLAGPLSDRELELLRLISKGCTNMEIAAELVIALGTVKRHTANIFDKLDVHNRTEAVARARELHLL